jgi:hypothetical protein
MIFKNRRDTADAGWIGGERFSVPTTQAAGRSDPQVSVARRQEILNLHGGQSLSAAGDP